MNDAAMPVSSLTDSSDSIFELGLWLSALESFLNVRNHSFTDESRANAASRDWTKEFRLIHSTLLLCAKLNFELGKSLRKNSARQTENNRNEAGEDFDSAKDKFEYTPEDVYALSVVLKDSILLNEGLLRGAPLRFGEWSAWSAFLGERLKSNDSFDRLIKTAEKSGEEFLPDALQRLFEKHSFGENADLRNLLPHYAKILKWLSVVGRMLERDEPLKPTLLIFSRVYEQIQEMLGFLNNRLLRFTNQENALFASLDAAAYTASIELKKVYNQELTGVVGIRPAPSVHAKIETAYALLNDSFQQTLIGFAQLLEPNVESRQIFPSFQGKYEQSKILRQDLWRIIETVKYAEQNPQQHIISQLNIQLTDFLKGSLHFLFYKDKETVERFVEEILITSNKKDLVPILHRFGAYLETLFGQVNMRTVLANHPFQPKT
ncbi:MAG TPA: hypothetical protein VF556_04275 [Pyrinomonadaceae bacterium]|jgi:hypothetical protein